MESRFADGEAVTGIVEWIILVGGMEKGKFLPSISSMVGARTASGLEFAVGPNLSMSGISMVFGAGYNFKSGDLNIPINFAFVPGKKEIHYEDAESEYQWVEGDYDSYGNWVPGYDHETITTPSYKVHYHTGNRFSITLGFNMSK